MTIINLYKVYSGSKSMSGFMFIAGFHTIHSVDVEVYFWYVVHVEIVEIQYLSKQEYISKRTW